MNRLPFVAVVTLACMLALAILLEYRGGTGAWVVAGPGLSVPSPAFREARPVAQAARPGGISSATLEGWVRTILERPLFNPSRRPGPVAAAAPAELPRLAGIIIDPGGARAIFATAGGARAIVAGAGAHAGPYLIRAVRPNGVSVVGPNGPELLHPTYDPNASRGSAGAGFQAPASGQPAGGAGSSILDLLRARAQNGNGPPLAPTQRFPAPQR